jgi:hypothetical protein
VQNLPLRPPILCAGCLHRAAFYAIKRVFKDAIYPSDIGCYTLGKEPPLEKTEKPRAGVPGFKVRRQYFGKEKFYLVASEDTLPENIEEMVREKFLLIGENL